MLDKLHLFVPFRLEHIELLGVEGRADPVHVVDLESLGVPLQGQISRGEGGELQADYLRHVWESLSTGFTPLAFKVFHQSLG
ncbi:replication initiation protein, partial [Pseudomonas aeruginosa]